MARRATVLVSAGRPGARLGGDQRRPGRCRRSGRSARGRAWSIRTRRSSARTWCGTTRPGTDCRCSTRTWPTWPGPPLPPGVRGFRVLDAAPYREKTVAGWARRDGIGTLEIKQRGTPVIPDDLRRRLRPALTGPTTAAATLVVARIGSDAAGVLVPGGRSGRRGRGP